MRDQIITTAKGRLVIGCDRSAQRAWIEPPAPDDLPTTVHLSEGELLMIIEALGMAYAELVGARPDSIARGISRTLRNRTRVARENASRPGGADRW